MAQKKVKELDVLLEVLSETKRFEGKLKTLIADLKEHEGDKSHYTKYRAGVKRAAIDLKNELSKISTATGTNGDYYYA